MGRKLYYRRDSEAEMDFVIRFEGKPTLVEVKPRSTKAKFADHILANPDTYGVDLCIKLCDRNVGYEGEKLTLPYYMAFLLTEDLS